MVGVYRGWHALESREGGPPIVDFDLAPVDIPARGFQSRIEVLDALEDLAGGLPLAHPFLIQRVRASIATLRSLLGQQSEFSQYIGETLQLDAVPIPEPVVERQRGVVTRILDRTGLGYDRQSRRRVAERFSVDLEGGPLQHWLSSAGGTDVGQAQALLALDIVPDHTLRFVSSPAYWKGWSSAAAGEPTCVYYNVTPRSPYLRGDAFSLANHEVAGHILQMECWRRSIVDGDLHPAYGVTVVHSFEQFLYEGLAQTITDLAFDDHDLDEDVLWAREYPRYHSYVYQRAHLDMNLGRDARAIFHYLRDALPFETDVAMEMELRSRCLDPVLRSYQFVYAASDCKFLEGLRTWGKDWYLGFVRSLYRRPHTMDEVLQLLQQGPSPTAELKG
jgi:hypothetical protein